jgi:hypothetical protein
LFPELADGVVLDIDEDPFTTDEEATETQGDEEESEAPAEMDDAVEVSE